MGGSMGGKRIRGVAALVLTLALSFVVAGCASRSPLLDMSAEELYAYGVEAYEREEWDDAIRGLERLLGAHPTFAQTPEARLLLARTHYQREEYLTAISEYERFIQRHPGRAEAPDAALGICHAYRELAPIPQRDQGYTHQAATACQNVARDYAGTDQAQEAWEIRGEMLERIAEKEFLTGRFYFRRNLFDSGLIYFQRVVEEYPDSQWAPQSLLFMFRTYENIGYEEEAEDVKEQIMSRYPDSLAAQELNGTGA